MINLNDDDVVGLFRVIIEMTKMLIFSLITQEVFDGNHAEWFHMDLTSVVKQEVASASARTAITDMISDAFEELKDEVKYISALNDPDSDPAL